MSRVKKRGKKSTSGIALSPMLILIVLVVIGIGGYYIYNKYQGELFNKHKVVITYNDNLKLEINDEVVLKTLIKEVNNGIILNGDDMVDTSKLGKKEVELNIKNNAEETEIHKFNVEIIDTTKPVIEAKKEIKVYVGNNVDLLKDVKVNDNSKEEIKAKVVGDYDINKVGEYKLKYQAQDTSGNTGEYDFILNIISDPNNMVFTTSKGFSGKVVNGVTYIDGVLIANKTYSLPSDYGNGLTSETQNAFNRMRDDAKALGLNLWLSSGYRSYWDQKIIYNNYVARDGQTNADTYSARPGHSEHQTGLAFDLNTIDDSFTYTAEGKWVHDNCYKYGLALRYPLGKESITGYMHESWHMRYLGVELATKLYNGGDWITLEEYYGIDSKYR